MERILNLESEFDVALFDKVVDTALNSSDSNKAQAENVLLRFKELPNSWTKVDFILKNSKSQQSRFIALQILEENVQRKWSLFDESMKAGIREYVFSDIVNAVEASEQDIVLKKFSAILVSIVKKDFPKKWPSFVNDLISVSQRKSMAVCANALEILKTVNDQAFQQNEDLTEARKRVLRKALQNEYGNVFSFFMNILEYSEKNESDPRLLKNCLICFSSFCKSMQAEYIFSTRAIEIICNHLNSTVSIEVLKCLLEILDLFVVKNEDSEDQAVQIPPEIDRDLVVSKVNLIHAELLSFFKLYMGKFDSDDELASSFRRFDDLEKLFVKSYARCFCAIYSNFFEVLNVEETKQGLVYLKDISKIPDNDLFREIFPTWRNLIYFFYAEYPMRSKTAKALTRNRFSFVLVSMFPVFINFMPRPEEVFIIINELGEVVKDKNVQTGDIEFCKHMRENFQYLSYCIKDEILKHLSNELTKVLRQGHNMNPVQFNKLCWAIGCFSGALDQREEHQFFLSVMQSILTLCACSMPLNHKAIVASNIMYIIGQYKRVLINNIDFTSVSLVKLFEFMKEDYEGIKEMACDNTLKLCENCSSQFFKKYENNLIIDSVVNLLSGAAQCLDFYLQRILVEGLFGVLKANSIENSFYYERILNSCTNKKFAVFNPQFLANINAVKPVCHFFECYSLGFSMAPHVFLRICDKNEVIKFYVDLTQAQNSLPPNLVKILKSSIVKLCIEMVKAEVNAEFYEQLTEYILTEYKTIPYSCIVELNIEILKNSPPQFYTQNVLFSIGNIVLPSIPLLNEGDANPDVSLELISLLTELLDQRYSQNMAVLMADSKFDQLYASILYTIGCMKEISDKSLNFLKLLLQRSYENNNQGFFNRCLLQTLENIIGLIIDKDTKQNHELQVELLYEIIFISQKIRPISNETNNLSLINRYLTNLFKSAFPNVTERSLNLFITGLGHIKNKLLFLKHVDDFTVKIYEMGTDEDWEEEAKILEERIAVVESTQPFY